MTERSAQEIVNLTKLSEKERQILHRLAGSVCSNPEDQGRDWGMKRPRFRKLISKLVDAGVVKGWRLVVDRPALGQGQQAVILVTLKNQRTETLKAFQEYLEDHEEVNRLLAVLGAHDFVIEFIGADQIHLEHFRRSVLRDSGMVQKTQTLIALRPFN